MFITISFATTSIIANLKPLNGPQAASARCYTRNLRRVTFANIPGETQRKVSSRLYKEPVSPPAKSHTVSSLVDPTRGTNEATEKRRRGGGEPVFEDALQRVLFTQNAFCTMDSVNSHIAPYWTTPNTGGATDFLETPESPTSCNVLEDNVLSCLLDKRNLTLDSNEPALVPHLVIIPPDLPYDGYWSYLHNGVEPQSSTSLTVPPRLQGLEYWPPENLHTTWRTAHCSSVDDAVYVEQSDVAWTEYALAVFSPRRFKYAIEAASEERLMLYHVIPSLHKKHFKAAVILASNIAQSFRERWDSPEFVESFEKPFRWTDPAEPLLDYHRRNPLSIILDSTTPCTTPHIIIEEAPLQDPWEACVNSTISPQDCGFGYFLTVPFHHVDFVNVPIPPPLNREDTSEYDTYDDSLMMTPALSESLLLTEDDSSWTPGTDSIPLQSEGSRVEFGKSLDSDMSSDIYNSFDDEDDEDGLPPLDDWYLTIMRRQQMAI